MAHKNTDRFVHIGDRQFIDYRSIGSVIPVEESAEKDEFAQMMSGAGLFKRSLVTTEDGQQLTSTEEVEVIMQRIDQATCPDCEEQMAIGAQDASIGTMQMLAENIEEALPDDVDPVTIAIVKQWLRDSAEATLEDQEMRRG